MINKIYNDKNIINAIKQRLKREGVIQLEGFFDRNFYENLKYAVKQKKFEKEYTPLDHKYSVSKINGINIDIIKKYLKNILGNFKGIKWETISLEWKDYKIINDDEIKKRQEIIIDVSDLWNPDYGGNIVYTDGKGNAIKTNCKGNSLIISDNKKFFNYISYVNHYAMKKRRLLIIGRVE